MSWWERDPVDKGPQPAAWWEGDPAEDPSAAQKIQAMGRTATGGAIEAGSTIAGMAMGAKIGALGGPAAPVTMPLGAALGAGAGYIAGRQGREMVGSPDIHELPEGLRPYGIAGEVVGAGTPFAGAPLALAKTGARLPKSTVGNFLNKVIDWAGKSPAAFTSAEMSALGGAALGGATAETYYPGKLGPRVSGEVAGGFFNPGRLTFGLAKMGADGVKKVASGFTQAGRESAAGKIIRKALNEAGEDAGELAKKLRQAPVGTSAQSTGSPTLARMEASLMKKDPRFGLAASKQAQESLETLQKSIGLLRETGDPQALKMAADLQAVRFRTLLAGRISRAEEAAVETAARITSDTPATRAELSQRTRGALDGALKDARSAERELWQKVPMDVDAGANNLSARFNALKDERLPEDPMPVIIESFMARMQKQDLQTTSGDLIKFRREALSLARESDVAGRTRDARVYGKLAEAALDDLDQLSIRGVDEYTSARQFSRELNNVFTRTFAGQAMETGARGRDRIPPELLMRRATATGGEAANIKFREIEEAVAFVPRQGLGGPAAVNRLDEVIDAQERILRLVASEAADPITGAINPAKLAKIKRDNQSLFDRFPEVSMITQEAVRSAVRRDEVRKAAGGLSRTAEQQGNFARLIQHEQPADAIREAISSKTPVQEITKMVKVAKRGNEREGLASAAWQYAINQGGNGQQFDFAKIRRAMFEPMRPGHPSLAQVLKREGIVDQKSLDGARKMFEEADRIITVLQAESVFEGTSSVDFLTESVLRFAGSRAATVAADGKIPPLIAATRGSEAARKVFDKIPSTKIGQVLIEAAKDPQFAAMLIADTTDPDRAFELARGIHAYIWQAGITAQETE